MADIKVNIQASTPVEKDFQQVHDIVVFHRSEVARKVNTEMLQMAWEIGQYISARIKSASWGAKVVDELSEYLQQREPGSRGFGRRNLYNMVTFYDKPTVELIFVTCCKSAMILFKIRILCEFLTRF